MLRTLRRRVFLQLFPNQMMLFLDMLWHGVLIKFTYCDLIKSFALFLRVSRQGNDNAA